MKAKRSSRLLLWWCCIICLVFERKGDDGMCGVFISLNCLSGSKSERRARVHFGALLFVRCLCFDVVCISADWMRWWGIGFILCWMFVVVFRLWSLKLRDYVWKHRNACWAADGWTWSRWCSHLPTWYSRRSQRRVNLIHVCAFSLSSH